MNDAGVLPKGMRCQALVLRAGHNRRFSELLPVRGYIGGTVWGHLSSAFLLHLEKPLGMLCLGESRHCHRQLVILKQDRDSPDAAVLGQLTAPRGAPAAADVPGDRLVVRAAEPRRDSTAGAFLGDRVAAEFAGLSDAIRVATLRALGHAPP